MASIGQEINGHPGVDARSAPRSGSYSLARATGPPRSAYAELRRLIEERGLLDRRPVYYSLQIMLALGLFSVSVALFVLIDALWVQLLNAVFLAFIFQLFVFIGHDSAHRQVTRSVRNNDRIALVFWNLLMGVSKSWWFGRHNRHHAKTNRLDEDPDAELWFLCFSEEAACKKRGTERLLLKYQVFLAPMLSLYPVVLRYFTFRFLIWVKGSDVGEVPAPQRYSPLEMSLVAVHFLLYFGLLFYVLGVWQAGLFVLIHQGLWGLYYASVTATNHKGMPVLGKDDELDFLHQQVITSRNIKSHPVVDFLFGGLNFQIEHHLFPTMPRNKLKEAQTIVRPFCEKQGIAYSETGLLESYRDIMGSLRETSLVARESLAQDRVGN